jgi:two-component system, sensor histidine kinase and response regulator
MVRVKLPAQRRQDSGPQRKLELTCMSNLLSATGERVYFKDLQSRFLLVSAGWITAYTPDRAVKDLIGKTDFDVFSGEHAAAAFRDEQQVIRTGEPIVGKVELETYGGRAGTWVSTTKMPLRDEGGQIIGTFGISRDVTAQIRAENTLAQQALQLRSQNESLRGLDRLKDEFIGLVSHELRTPLASILGYVEILGEDVSGPDADHCVKVIERNAQRLLRLVGDLQLLSQIQSGKMAMEFGSADLADIAACAVEELRPEAQRKHIDLALSVTAIPVLSIDLTRIAQLLGNLLSNAVKFTPEGGRVEVRLGREEGQAVLAVTDTGVGIPAADRERIFERFYRTAIARRQEIQGTGLGLTITKAIVKAHHGTISVESDEGRGSTFTVRLPLLPVPVPDTQEPSDASDAALQSGHYRPLRLPSPIHDGEDTTPHRPGRADQRVRTRLGPVVLLLAVDAEVDPNPPWVRVYLPEGLWLTRRAARIGYAESGQERDIAVTIEQTSPPERVVLFARAFGFSAARASCPVI